jgi:hypothetical protein
MVQMAPWGGEGDREESERVKTHLVYDTAVRPSLGYDCMEGPIVHNPTPSVCNTFTV